MEYYTVNVYIPNIPYILYIYIYMNKIEEKSIPVLDLKRGNESGKEGG